MQLVLARASSAKILHNGAVAKRRNPLEVVQAEGPNQLAFLSAAGMSGPHLTDDGIVYRSDNLEISMSYYGYRDAGVYTSVRRMTPDGTWRWAGLSCLHVACGHGVLQDVPHNAPNQTVASKRVTQHAAALRRMLPRLMTNDAITLVRRCQSRELPLAE